MRKRMRGILARMPDATRRTASVSMWRTLQSWPEWKMFERVLAFVPLPEEPQLFDFLLDSGKVVGAPRVVSAGLEFCLVNHPSQLVREPLPGKSNRVLCQPGANCTPIIPSKGDLVLVPGLAFTTRGERLGRGGGYYDRFLQTFPGTAWGVCFACQIVESLPTEAHDLQVARVFTEAACHSPRF